MHNFLAISSNVPLVSCFMFGNRLLHRGCCSSSVITVLVLFFTQKIQTKT